MILNLTPLKIYRDYRLLFFGQMVSFFGSMVSYVAVPYQVYTLTHSSLVVGFLGAVQLIPMVLFGLLGGSVADSMDRRKLLFYSELGMSAGSLALVYNACLDHPSVTAIFILIAFMQAANGFHRPAMEALSQKIVRPEHYSSVSALGSLRSTVGSVAGPALGGILMTVGGAKLAYSFDFATYLVAVVLVYKMRPQPVERAKREHLGSILEGLRFAWERPVLLGTYAVDIIAMTFAFPTALFPALAEPWGGAKAAGILFSSMSVGAFLVAVFSGWTTKIKRHGASVTLAAGAWGLSVIALGLAPNIWMASLALVLCGATDGISALFRGIIWNETIPNQMRGRLAGLEMISFMTGPLLGNTRAGWMAAAGGNQFSIISGGILCVVGVFLSAFFLPVFWTYRSKSPNQIS